LITLFSPLASPEPDGLERVAEDKEFVDRAKDPPYEAIADYVFPWVGNEDAATVLAGVTGVAIVAALVFGLGFALLRIPGRAASSRNARLGRDSPP
jgi:hypothetical protein